LVGREREIRIDQKEVHKLPRKVSLHLKSKIKGGLGGPETFSAREGITRLEKRIRRALLWNLRKGGENKPVFPRGIPTPTGGERKHTLEGGTRHRRAQTEWQYIKGKREIILVK